MKFLAARLSLIACGVAALAALPVAAAATSPVPTQVAPTQVAQGPQHIKVCGAAPPGFARCHAVLVLGLDRAQTVATRPDSNGRKPSPTIVPSSTPTDTATNTPVPPTDTATDTPTVVLTTTPTIVPSSTPTGTPTSTPTHVPTTTPTIVPSSTQTAVSTTTPTPIAPRGYGPSDLQSAYKLPSSTAGSGQTVAIVDAYDDPTAESDLAVYRSRYGLPACTTANGCFRKVDQNGGTSYPTANGGWAQEISLDLDMVSAICPNCHILLVEASSSYLSDLGTAVNTAARLGATAISNSYGGSEYSGEASAEKTYYNHPGIAITASSGDSGYGVEFPAASQYVTAVGGTSLTRASTTRGWTETTWSGAGSGCSAYIAKPSWQTDGGCAKRTVADVSAVADPNTGVAVYDSYAHQGVSGWLVFGGTSVASPIIASVYALAGNQGSVTYGSYPYSHLSSLFDIASGSNGSCGGSYLCTAWVGYDGPTGLGTPNGTTGF